MRSQRFFIFFASLIGAHVRADLKLFGTTQEPFDTDGRMSRSLFAWAPIGGAQARVAPECDVRILERGMIGAPTSAARVQYARQYFQACGKNISQGLSSPLVSIARSQLVRSNYRQAHAPIDLLFTDSHGSKIRGQLFLKPDSKPRPLVIYKGGLQSDIGGPTVTMAMMYLFEEGPFHVLTVGSTTGRDFEVDNQMLSFGGYQEGRQLIEIAQYLRQKPQFSRRISSLHVVGTSLGGHAALYASLFNRYTGDGNLIRSFIAGCPVVNLEYSVRQLYTGGGLVGRMAHSRLFGQVGDLAEKIPFLGKLFEGRPKREKLYGVLSQQAFESYRNFSRDESMRPAPYKKVWIDSVEKLWEVNDFLRVQHLVRSPTFVFSSGNDPVVHSPGNSDLLAAMPNLSSAIQILPLSKGGHCDLWSAYGWETMGTLLRSWVLSHSPELLKRRKLVSHTVEFPAYFASGSFERLRAITWEARSGDDFARLRSSLEDRTQAREMRRRSATLKFRLLDLGITNAPNNEAQAESLTRFLNRNIFVSGSKSGSFDKSEAPRRIEWYEY